jgi:hypothetical protein
VRITARTVEVFHRGQRVTPTQDAAIVYATAQRSPDPDLSIA